MVVVQFCDLAHQSRMRAETNNKLNHVKKQGHFKKPVWDSSTVFKFYSTINL